ncbi:MAG TPA: methyltransferase domain-containing protein [Stellaceae bacterium]|nr:methyltransferase domain-containing protein [Stellaceae bacterium]
MTTAIPVDDRQSLAEVHGDIDRYYSAKIIRHGVSPRGVDWTCQATQELRFVQLVKLFGSAAALSLNDLGCGYGALLDFLRRRHAGLTLDYLGIDLSKEMVRRAKRKWRGVPDAAFAQDTAPRRAADYSVASGIFNVQLDQPTALWEAFIATTLRDLRNASLAGFAVNFLAPLAADQPPRHGLYRTAPEPWIRYCRDDLGGTTTLLDAYGMREFTILVQV